MSSSTASRYQCEECKTVRNAVIDKKYHQENMLHTTNGLVIYSDIHRCSNGILGINNLHVDADFRIRSSEFVTLPSKRVTKSSSIPNLPSPKLQINETQDILIREFHENRDFRLLIKDRTLKVIMNIGVVDIKKEQPIATLQSKREDITLQYYPSNIIFTQNIKQWLKILINLLETLPPTRIGLFIETLRYIEGLKKIGPAGFHINILRMILSSHQIFFDPVSIPIIFDPLIDEGVEKYGQDAVTIMIKILSYLELNPNVPLLYYTSTHHEDIGYLIYLFLTLEQENMIQIYKPF